MVDHGAEAGDQVGDAAACQRTLDGGGENAAGVRAGESRAADDLQAAALTARLLKIVNSAYFGFAAQIDTVNHAVSILGVQQIQDLVLATSVA